MLFPVYIIYKVYASVGQSGRMYAGCKVWVQYTFRGVKI